MTSASKEQAFAIIRYDVAECAEPNTDVPLAIAIIKVLHEEAAAIAECKRLNSENDAKGVRYFWQATRLVS